MKTGRTLTDLAIELDRQVKSKKDYLADTRGITMSEDGTALSLKQNGTLQVTELCHDQIAARLQIPSKYYQKMQAEYPGLLASNVNAWFQRNPEKRLVRVLDNKARAFLSDRFRPLDNYDLAEVVLPKIQKAGCRIESAELTERRLYIKAVTERISAEVKKGDIVQAGLVISNSEVGCGSVKVEPMIFRLVCLNGMIAPDFGMRKYHVGRGDNDMENEAIEFYKDETRLADDRAFWLKVRDVVDATLTKTKFERIVDKLREASDRKIIGDPVKTVNVITKRMGFNDSEHGSVLNHLIAGGDLSCYGLSNAVTRASQDIDNYDRATDFERFGGDIIRLNDAEWKSISNN
jgi:hypothetical protein